ncbi:hypothetical protein [Cytobacillus sp. IB215665]|uniref:hypothetical protein n=1 Tax=Cytobacillus sp. IB215665 TaxID=3097357 RepID=UPI002A1176E2|nr:hypothetical protein [Cytobacillus sp. IB215665]MDX8363772.1 hypothetical protein [Cytobacillus sp. IB215665]
MNSKPILIIAIFVVMLSILTACSGNSTNDKLEGVDKTVKEMLLNHTTSNGENLLDLFDKNFTTVSAEQANEEATVWRLTGNYEGTDYQFVVSDEELKLEKSKDEQAEAWSPATEEDYNLLLNQFTSK